MAIDVCAPEWRGYFESPTYSLNYTEAHLIDTPQHIPNGTGCGAASSTNSAETNHSSIKWPEILSSWIASLCNAVCTISLICGSDDCTETEELSQHCLPLFGRKGMQNKKGVKEAQTTGMSPTRHVAILEAPDVSDNDKGICRVQPSPNSVLDTENITDSSRASPVNEPCEQEASCSQTDEETPGSNVANVGCFGPPGRSARSHKLLAGAANLLRDVYVHLAKHNVFEITDILEAPAPLNCASLDPIGVLFSAQTIARNVLTEELLSGHSGLPIRELLATILLMCYKVRTEARWDSKHLKDGITVCVMHQFLNDDEFKVQNAAAVRKNMLGLEAQLLENVPIFRLIDETPHAACEWHIYDHYDRLQKAFRASHSNEVECSDNDTRCHADMMLALSGAYFYYHAACLSGTDMLEEMGQFATSDTLGQALAHICLRGIWLIRPWTAELSPQPPCIAVTRMAVAFVSNAARLSAQRVEGLRKGEQLNPNHPCQQLISQDALARLMLSFAPYTRSLGSLHVRG